MKKIFYYVLALLGLLSSTASFAQDRELVQVLIGNEGGFNDGNATITSYIVESSTATDGVYFDANGVSIGDVLQSLAWIDNKIFAVVNNSQTIAVLDPETFAQTGAIVFGSEASPREIVKISDSKAYVTDFYTGTVKIVNLNDYSVSTKSIPVGFKPDKILYHKGFVYVSNSGGFGSDSTIFKINVSTDMVVDTIFVSRGPGSMIIDSQEHLWVVCTGYSGDYDENWNVIEGTSRPGGVHKIDLNTGESLASVVLASAGDDIGLSKDETTLFVNAGGILTISTADLSVASEPLVSGNFYAMGYDSEGGRIFTADVKDYSSAGEISVYDTDGTLSTQFSAGIIPGSFLMVYSDMVGTSVEQKKVVSNFILHQNYPNPFNPTTTIQYYLDTPSFVRLEVFNSLGQKVAELENSKKSAGLQQVSFDAGILSSGIYLYRLTSNAKTEAKKMILIK